MLVTATSVAFEVLYAFVNVADSDYKRSIFGVRLRPPKAPTRSARSAPMTTTTTFIVR